MIAARRLPAALAATAALLLAAGCSGESDGATTSTTVATTPSTAATTTTVATPTTTPPGTTLRFGEPATIDLQHDGGPWAVEMTVDGIERFPDQDFGEGAVVARYVARVRWRTIQTTDDVPRAQRNHLALVARDGSEPPTAPLSFLDGEEQCTELPETVAPTPGQVIEFCDLFPAPPGTDVAGVSFSPPAGTYTWRDDG